MVFNWISTLCLAAAGLGCLYMLAAAVLVGRFARGGPPPASSFPPVTILKPLHGDEPGLFENLASFCAQDYLGPVQIVFGVQDPADSAVAVVKRLAAAFPDRALDLVIEARANGTNRKVSNLVNMAPLIRHDIVVLADSDMQVPPDYLVRIVAALQQPGIGLVTCLYHGVPASDRLWPRLSGLAIDTHFPAECRRRPQPGLGAPVFWLHHRAAADDAWRHRRVRSLRRFPRRRLRDRSGRARRRPRGRDPAAHDRAFLPRKLGAGVVAS